jgi:K+-sensing histidine kinase KdpD
MTRYLSRDRIAITAALAAPLAAAAILLPFRASWSNTNVALLLVVVVVGVAAIGNRVAGGLAAVWAAIWFDFFFTLPYYRFTIRSTADVTTAVLLLLVGLAVSQLAVRARRLRVIAITDAGYLAQIHETASLAQSARSPDAVVDHVREQLTGLLDLQGSRFEYGTCSATRRGWSRTAPYWQVMAAGMLRRRACPQRKSSCGLSATGSTTGVSC